MTTSTLTQTYNGWANYETWNVSLYINNEYSFYQAMCDYVQFCIDHDDTPTYSDFISSHHYLLGDKTPDGVSWTNPTLNQEELNEMVWEYIV